LWTVVSVAVVAYAACDIVHEALGHGLACWLLPDVRALSLSTIGLQTDESSRVVAAAGSLANLVVGLVAVMWFRRGRGFDAGRYFAWLFATLNLFNATGYLVFSGVLDFGDWAVVIGGIEPHWLWRVVLIGAGLALYTAVIRFAARALAGLVERGDLALRDIPRITLPAYVAGGLLLVAASVLNPVGPELILASGASTGFGAMVGLTLVRRFVDSRSPGTVASAPGAGSSRGWIVCAAIVAVVFIAILGRGVALS